MAKQPIKKETTRRERPVTVSDKDEFNDQPMNRLANRAYLREGSFMYEKETLLLALLLHTTGTAKRSAQEMKQVQTMLDDPNLDRKRKPNRRK